MTEQKESASSAVQEVRFFDPRPSFWAALLRLNPPNLIDCGTGLGQLPMEARMHGIRMIGIDVCRREGQHVTVLIRNALNYPWSSSTWPLICRPDHNGWCQRVINKALLRGAKALYVGTDRGLQLDVEGPFSTVAENVGLRGENLYISVAHV